MQTRQPLMAILFRQVCISIECQCDNIPVNAIAKLFTILSL